MKILDFGLRILDWKQPLRSRLRAEARNPKSAIQNPKSLRPLLAALPLLAAPLPAIPLADLLPDTAPLVIIARDAPSLIDRVKTSPWADTWNDDRVKKFLAPLRDKIRCDDWPSLLRDHTGLTPAALQTLIQGDILLALLPGNAEPQLGLTTTPPILLAADLAPDAPEKLHPLLAALADKTTPDTPPPETYATATIHTLTPAQIPTLKSQIPPTTIYWTITENRLLASNHRALLLRTLDAQQTGGITHPLGKTTPYLAHLDATPGLYLHLNPQAALRTAPPGITTAIPANLHAALRLDTLDNLTCTLALTPRATRLETTLTYAEKRGILSLLAFTDTPLKLPSAASADWPALSVANIDIPALITALQDLLYASNPALPAAIQSRLNDIADTYSLQIRRDLLDNLGDQLITAYVPPPGIPPDAPNLASQLGATYIVPLRDPRTFQNTLAGLIRALGLDNNPAFTTRDYLGATIHTLDNPRQQPLSLAIAQNQLILTLGATTITETIVQNIINGPATPVTTDPATRAMFDAAPADIRYFTAQNLPITLSILAARLVRSPKTRPLVTPSALPPPATFEKHWDNLYAWLTEKSGHLTITTEIPYKK